jgi:CO/xanthine dehydrogenase FAD-binding subunit
VSFFCGGTGYFKVPKAKVRSKAIVQLTAIPEMRVVNIGKNEFTVGAATTLAELHKICSGMTRTKKHSYTTLKYQRTPKGI